MTTTTTQPAPINEPGHLLSWSLIGILLILLFAALVAGVESGPMKAGLGTVILGTYVMAWGLCFLASYYYSHKAFFLRGLMWMCEHFSAPSSPKMALFYFALATLLGGAAVLTGVGLI